MNNINYINGNIFTSKHQTLVNTINCVGEMGTGIALEFRYRYPEMYDKYVKFCELKQIDIGTLWIYKTEKKWILNFPTKKHWRYSSKMEYLIKGLQKFVDTYKQQNIESIAFPLLGAQNGGLDPNEVKETMFEYLNKCDIPIEIYEYNKHSKDDLIDSLKNYIDSTNENQIELSLDLNKNMIKLIKNALSKKEIYSLMQLKNLKGIGENTLAKLYHHSMNNGYISKTSMTDEKRVMTLFDNY